MKKLTTATIATFGLVTLGVAAQDDAQAAEQHTSSYAYTTYYSQETNDYITVDQYGNKHHTLDGNWDPSAQYTYYTFDANGVYDFYYYNYNGSYNYSYSSQYYTTAAPAARYNYESTSYNYNYSAPNYNYNYSYNYNAQSTVQAPAASTTSYNTTTTAAPAPSNSGYSSTPVRFTSRGGANLYTAGQCTYYVYNRVGGGIGNTWGNANNWASAARAAGYTVNNTPRTGAIMQTSVGPYGHVAYVESVNKNGSVTVSEMNYGHGAGVVTSRTLSASQAASQNFIYR
ncbi:CHAP domain-containing protein [Staphylococcus hyicus]|uniref:CHAP domain-containing protein n=1 Tax=Staphylococcus hyicus TaxID=1284 RepID=UPI002365E31B|nr:CHAP domain-containing protein [Staphylococcus hyicus]